MSQRGYSSGKRKYSYVQNLETFFMNKLSCLEHLSTLSLSTEMSEMMLHRKTTVNIDCHWCTAPQYIHTNMHTHTHLMLENLGVLSCLSMRLRRIWSTSSRISGSSVREKDSRGSRKELGNAVSMLVVWKPAVTWEMDNHKAVVVYNVPKHILRRLTKICITVSGLQQLLMFSFVYMN